MKSVTIMITLMLTACANPWANPCYQALICEHTAQGMKYQVPGESASTQGVGTRPVTVTNSRGRVIGTIR